MSVRDLEASLMRVLQHFAPMSAHFSVDWVDLDSADLETFDEKHDLAAVWFDRGTACIGIHPRLRRAPRYVIEYLIAHEVLHVALNCEGHPHHFRVAERLWPCYIRADTYLSSFYRAGKLS